MSDNRVDLAEIYSNAMQPKKPKRKSVIIMIAVLCLSVVLLIGTTFAHLTYQTNIADNKFAFGQTKITIIENENPNWDAKKVWLKAEAGPQYVPGVARVMFVPYAYSSDGTYFDCDFGNIEATFIGNVMVLGEIELVLVSNWQTNWFFKDGYFYYKKVLKPGEQTTQLLEMVSLTSLNAEMKAKYGNKLHIEVLATMLQSEGGAPEHEWNVKVSADGTTVSPS